MRAAAMIKIEPYIQFPNCVELLRNDYGSCNKIALVPVHLVRLQSFRSLQLKKKFGMMKQLFLLALILRCAPLLALTFSSRRVHRPFGSKLASNGPSAEWILRASRNEAEESFSGSPILHPSSKGDSTIQFDTRAIANPVVLPPSSPDNPKWQCYYYGNAGSWFNGTKSFLPTGWCGLAESDDGITWTKVPGELEGGAILAPSGNDEWDGIQLGVGDVVRVREGELHMYYFGGSNEELAMGPMNIVGFRMRIGRAKSLDGGRTWEKLGVCLDYDEEEGLFASWPRIIIPKDVNEPWRMIYHSFNGEKWRVFGATSTDQGETWTRTGLILEGGEDEYCFDFSGIGTRDITPWRDGMLMIYEAVDKTSTHRFGAAFCKDKNGAGKWEKLESGKPILEPGKGPMCEWTSHVIGTPYIVSMPDGSIRLYHCARKDAEEGMKIGVLVSETGDVSTESWKPVQSLIDA